MNIYGYKSKTPACYSLRITFAHFSLVILSVIISGCTPISPTASDDKALFNRLCEAAERNFVNEVPVVSGFAEGPENNRAFLCPMTGLPFERLVVDGFEYYECFETPWVEQQGDAPPILRITIKVAGDPTCNHPQIQKENNFAKRKIEDFPNLENKCFGAEDRNYIQSRLIVLHGGGAVNKKGRHLNSFSEDWHRTPGAISYARDRIVDQMTGTIIAEQKSYRYFPSGSRYVDLTGRLKCDAEIQNVSDLISSN